MGQGRLEFQEKGEEMADGKEADARTYPEPKP